MRPRAVVLLACLALAGCAAPPAGQMARVDVSIQASGGPVGITHAQARVQHYGLVISGGISIAPHTPAQTVHSVDIVIMGPDGAQIRKFTSQYFPAPRADRKKPQRAHFTMITYELPPAGSTVQVSLTPQPKVEVPPPKGEPAPESR